MARKIMIDAGHFGKMNAGVVHGYYESEMNWKLQEYLANELEEYGFEVGKTRDVQTKDLPLEERGRKAKGYDLFISLHSNAVAGSEATKRVVVIKALNGSADEIADRLAKTVLDTMDLTKDKYWYSQVITRQYSTSRPNVDYYGVIRGAVSVGVPALIVEHSFHTNTEACKWLMNDNNLKKLAEAEAKTIADFYGYKKPEIINAYYRVQIGAFSNKENAENLAKKLNDEGYQTVIKYY